MYESKISNERNLAMRVGNNSGIISQQGSIKSLRLHQEIENQSYLSLGSSRLSVSSQKALGIPLSFSKSGSVKSITPMLSISSRLENITPLATKEEQSILARVYQSPNFENRKNQQPNLNDAKINPKLKNAIQDPKMFPNHLLEAIVEIYGVGFNYNHDPKFGQPTGVGFLITKNLIITANSVIPDETSASRCFCRFIGAEEKIFFDSRTFFYTNRGLNYTIVTFYEGAIHNRRPIEIRETYILRDADNIYY